MSNYNKLCNNLPTILPPANRIIAIGDVHGDMKLVLSCLLIPGLIEKTTKNKNSIEVILNNKKSYYCWSGKDTIVVQIGDQNDGCRPNNSDTSSCNGDNDIADDIQILNFFTKLHEVAKLDKGGVYSLLGNHELMNVEGNFSYTSKKNIDVFKNYVDPYTKQKFKSPYEARTHAFARGNEYARFLGCTRQSILLIGDFLFVHAGLNPEFLENFQGRDKLQELNDIVQKWLLNQLDNSIIDEKTMDKIISDSTYSPFWNRVLGNLKPTRDHLLYENSKECQDALKPIIDSYQIKGMIIGHTPQMDDGINAICNNMVFRTDFGGSKAFDRPDINKREPQVLEIKKLNDGSYKYSVIYEKKETYTFVVPDDNSGFSRVVANLPQ